MSLEALLAENTEAVKALTAAILAQAAAPQSSGAAHETPQADLAEPAAPKPARGRARAAAANAPTVPTATAAQAAAPASKPSAPPSPQPASAQTPDAPAANAPAAEAAPDYETAARAVTALAKARGREAAVAVLAQFGAARLPEVAPEQFAAVIAACEQAQEAAGAQA
jgi:bbp35